MSLINIIKIWRSNDDVINSVIYPIKNNQHSNSIELFYFFNIKKHWAIDKLKHFFSFLCWETLSRALLSRLPLPEFIFFHQVLMTSLSSFLKTRLPYPFSCLFLVIFTSKSLEKRQFLFAFLCNKSLCLFLNKILLILYYPIKSSYEFVIYVFFYCCTIQEFIYLFRSNSEIYGLKRLLFFTCKNKI